MQVSIVIPCRDAAPYIAQAVISALSQAHPLLEILVVDDGSTDESVDILHRIAAADARVSVFRRNYGTAQKARNFGLRHARGEVVMFLDADDVLAPETLASLVTGLGRGADIAACPWSRLEFSEGEWREAPPSCEARRPYEPPLSAWLRGWYYPPCALLFRRRLLEECGGWDEKATINQDGELIMRLLAQGARLAEVPFGTAFYRRAKTETQSVSGKARSREGLIGRIYVLDKIAGLIASSPDRVLYGQSLATAYGYVERDARAAGEQELAARLARRQQELSGGRLFRLGIRARNKAAALNGHFFGLGAARPRPVSLELEPGRAITYGQGRGGSV